MPAPPTDPDFWNTRYTAGRTPWDLGGVPPALTRFLGLRPAALAAGARVLLPGCGTGHEIGAFAAAGIDVTAIDFSTTAVERARANVGAALAGRLIEGDFFTHEFAGGPFDLIYERTFLCAMPPALWPQLGARTAELLRPGGMLAGLYFFGDKEDGPPFGLADGEPERLFGLHFNPGCDVPVPPGESLPLFAGRERWQERRRKTHE